MCIWEVVKRASAACPESMRSRERPLKDLLSFMKAWKKDYSLLGDVRRAVACRTAGSGSYTEYALEMTSEAEKTRATQSQKVILAEAHGNRRSEWDEGNERTSV
jgi:hypothetical protein